MLKKVKNTIYNSVPLQIVFTILKFFFIIALFTLILFTSFVQCSEVLRLYLEEGEVGKKVLEICIFAVTIEGFLFSLQFKLATNIKNSINQIWHH